MKQEQQTSVAGLLQAAPFLERENSTYSYFYPLKQNWTEMGPWPSMPEE